MKRLSTLPAPYYAEDGITIYWADSRALVPLLKEPVDLVLTDPPYDFKVSGGGMYGMPRTRGLLRSLHAIGSTSFVPQPWLASLPCSSVVAFCNKPLLEAYLQFARVNRLVFDVHVMIKTNAIPAIKHNWLPNIEYIVVMRARGSYFNAKGRAECYRKDYLHYNSGNWSAEKHHPAEKPVALLRRYIDVLCPEGGAVLDPYAGSGSTLVAAKECGARAIGIEREEKYCRRAVDRLRQANLPLTTGKQEPLTIAGGGALLGD